MLGDEQLCEGTTQTMTGDGEGLPKQRIVEISTGIRYVQPFLRRPGTIGYTALSFRIRGRDSVAPSVVAHLHVHCILRAALLPENQACPLLTVSTQTLNLSIPRGVVLKTLLPM